MMIKRIYQIIKSLKRIFQQYSNLIAKQASKCIFRVFNLSLSFVFSYRNQIQNSYYYLHQLFRMAARNQKQTVLDMLINGRANEQIQRKQSEKELIEIMNQKNQQIAVLHQINTRLGYELSICHRKLGIDADNIFRDLQNLQEISVAIHFQTGQLQYLDHLLNAYDENSLKQKKIIAMLYSQLEDAEKKALNLVKDNELLLQQNQNKCKKILEIYHKGNPQQSLVPSYNKLQRQMQNEKNSIIRSENEHLTQVYHDLEHRYLTLQKQLQQNKFSTEKYFSLYKKQSEELKQSLISVDNLLKVKQFLQKTVNKLGEENIELQTTKTELTSKISKLENEIKILRDQFNSQKKSLREDFQRIQLELDSAKSQSQNSNRRQKQLFQKNMMIEKEIESLRESQRTLKRQNQKLKSQFEQTLRMCEAYESKIVNNSRKQQNLRDILNQSKQKMDSLLLQRDKAVLKIQQLQKILENLPKKHRQQLAEQKHSFQSIINSLNTQIQNMNEQKETEQSIFLQSELSLKNTIEKLKKQNNQLHQQNNKFLEGVRVNTGSQIIYKLKQLEDKNQNLIKMLKQKEKYYEQDKANKEEIIINLQNENKSFQRQLQKQRQSNNQIVKELTQERSKISIIRNEKQCLESQIMKLKKSISNKLNEDHSQKQYKIRDLQEKLYEAVKKQKQTRLKAIEMLERYDEAQEKLKLEYQNRIKEVQKQNTILRSKATKKK